MFKIGFEFAMGIIAAYEVYSFIRYLILKTCEKIIERGEKYMRENESMFSEDKIKKLIKYAPDEVEPICKERRIGFVTNFDE